MMPKFSLENLRKSSVYITPNFPVLQTKRYKFSLRQIFFMISFYSICVALVILVILATTPLKEIVMVLEKERLAEQQVKVEELQDKIVYLSKELESMASANNRLKYAILLGTIDSLDSNSTIYDSLKNEENPNIPVGGSIYSAFKRILNSFSKEDSISNIFFMKPVKGFTSNKFNPRSGHLGIDFAVKIGTPIYSTANGLVIFSDYTSEFGNMLIIQHDEKYVSIYKHCKSLIKSEREYIYQGELIAISSNTGSNTTGPHLHFELWKDGKPIDPEKVFIK